MQAILLKKIYVFPETIFIVVVWLLFSLKIVKYNNYMKYEKYLPELYTKFSCVFETESFLLLQQFSYN